MAKREVIVQRGRVHHGEFFPEPVNDRFDLRVTDELDGLDWNDAVVVVRPSSPTWSEEQVEAAANESVSRGYLVKIEDLRAILDAAAGAK